MKTKTFSLFALSLLLSAVMLACAGGDGPNTPTANTGTNATASGEKIGVAECDDFLAKYETCVSGKVPAAAQAAFKSSMDTWRAAWKQQAANPQTKTALVQVCKAAADQSKTALANYNCSW